MGLIQPKKIVEGGVLNSYLENRFRKNKNFLGVVTGPTGSGKSYACLRIAELWYKYNFNKDFPVETHCCFTINELMKLLSSKTLKKGELIIFEEAGVSVGSLDFQQRISKLFTYVMQSFRSMNIGILFNLPVLTMLNKSCRLLLHSHIVTQKLDFDKKMSKLKPFFHQLNQMSGKSYWKYPKIIFNNRVRTIKRFNYYIPSKHILEVYEDKKERFVYQLTEDFSKELQEIENKIRKSNTLKRKPLTEKQQQVMDLLANNPETPTITDVAKYLNQSIPNISFHKKFAEKKGYVVEEFKKKVKAF